MTTEKPKPDIAHLRWAIEERANIQQTLLALYDFLRNTMPNLQNPLENLFFDHMIAAAFSLWRAVFLAERDRDTQSLRKAQEDFLATVISTNAITFSDDRSNSAWSVGFYLENAKHRILSAQQLALANPYEFSQERGHLPTIERLVHIRGDQVSHLRYEWQAAHAALRMLLRIEDPRTTLPIKEPVLPTE
jgi:hypothetical protein